MKTKVCKICGHEKLIEDFGTSKSKSGVICFRGWCKACGNKKQKEYFVSKPEYQQKKIREKNNYNVRLRAEKKGTWLKDSHLKIKEWSQEEYMYNIRQARKLKKSKEYFQYCNFESSDMVADAYMLLIEKGLEYSRWQFYLLMWNAMAREKYRQIKLSPKQYEYYLRSVKERKAIGRFLMEPWYIAQLNRSMGIDNQSVTSEQFEERKRQLLYLRKNKKLVGEFYAKRDRIIE